MADVCAVGSQLFSFGFSLFTVKPLILPFEPI